MNKSIFVLCCITGLLSLFLSWVVLLYILIMEICSMTRGRCCTLDLILKKIKI